MNSALRKLAIRLACAHPEDQEWILANLPPQERQQVEALLEEISLLGLAADPNIVAAVMQEVLPAPVNSPLPMVDDSVHPFWLALGVQAFSRHLQPQYLDKWKGKAGLAKWSKGFAEEPLPPGLLQHLKGRLERQGGRHEPE